VRGEKKLEKDIGWNELSLSHLDPCTKECELEVQKINSFTKIGQSITKCS